MPEELELKKRNIEVEAQSKEFQMPDLNLVRSYAEDLKSILRSASIIEQEAFLKSFVKDIQVGAGYVTIHYTLPMLSKNSAVDKIGVLSFIQSGEPCRSRTCQFCLLDTMVDRTGLEPVTSRMQI